MQTEAQIRKYSGYARAFCVLMFAVLTVMSLWGVRNIVFGPGSSGFRVDLGVFLIRGDQFTTAGVKLWGGLAMAAVFAIVFKGLFHLYSLFGNFRAGGIYTRENVRHIRQLGLLAMAMAVLQLLLPLASFLLVLWGFIDRSSITQEGGRPLPNMFSGLITASVILLASWIMDVGTRTREEADQMRRDAELVI